MNFIISKRKRKVKSFFDEKEFYKELGSGLSFVEKDQLANCYQKNPEGIIKQLQDFVYVSGQIIVKTASLEQATTEAAVYIKMITNFLTQSCKFTKRDALKFVNNKIEKEEAKT